MITIYRLHINIKIETTENEKPPTDKQVAEHIADLIRNEHGQDLDVKISALKLS